MCDAGLSLFRGEVRSDVVNGISSYDAVCEIKEWENAMSTNETQWILCPVCHGKTRTQVRKDTVLQNFPLFCPKCKRSFLISLRECKTEYEIKPDAKTQS